MSINRRELLRSLGGLCAWATLPELGACAEPDARAPAFGFWHHVASGDPLPDAVILWTRVTPRLSGDSYDVTWQVSADAAFREVVATGISTTDATRDFTVKVDADGLESGTAYYYRFQVEDITSPTGRTQTAPTADVSRLRFAVASCSSLAHGYFHGYRAISELSDLDAVIHLGDYIYEHANNVYGSVRAYEPAHELFTLSDYRQRYAQYRRDQDLQALHARWPLIAVWDDHEFANDAYLEGAQNHNPELGEGSWAERKAAALQAYAEWMPIREPAPGRVFRSFRFGELLDLIMLDTRSWGRQRQASGAGDAVLQDPERTLLGHDQEAWLGEQLQASRARWRVLGQQVMLGHFALGGNFDVWEGYPAARARLLAQLRAAPGDSVVLTGDVHSSWAMNVIDEPFNPAAYDPATGQGSYAVEFITPGITSPLLAKPDAEAWQPIALQQPHVKYAQLWRRGYMLIDVTAERVQADWYHFDAVDRPEPVSPTHAATAAAYYGERCVRL
ncbi:MAG: putative alkaline phosphatase [Pseudomonadota bacterium]